MSTPIPMPPNGLPAGLPPSTEEDPDITYASHVPPDHPGLRLERARPRTLRTGPALAAALGLIGAGGLAVVVATRPAEVKATPTATDTASKPVTIAETVQTAPGNDSPVRPPAPQLGPALHRRTGDNSRSSANPGGQSSPAENVAPSPRQQQREARRQALIGERDKALGAPLLVNFEDPIQAEPAQQANPAARTVTANSGAAEPAPAPPATGMAPGGPSAPDQNMQQRKNQFLAKDGVNNSTTSEQAIRIPRSPYELMAGAIIPTSLITGINSDLPGQIIGQVRENVYDTVTGRYLLIPQGSRLIATYDSMVGFGQERCLVCWNRLIRPDGISIGLECMPGVDLAGYAGFADEVDHHWWRILTGVALGSLVAAGAQASQGNVTGFQPSLPQLWVSGAASGVNQATQQLTQKNLQIQPTIKIRPGFSVNVLVTKDLVLPPYNQQGATP